MLCIWWHFHILDAKCDWNRPQIIAIRSNIHDQTINAYEFSKILTKAVVCLSGVRSDCGWTLICIAAPVTPATPSATGRSASITTSPSRTWRSGPSSEQKPAAVSQHSRRCLCYHCCFIWTNSPCVRSSYMKPAELVCLLKQNVLLTCNSL